MKYQRITTIKSLSILICILLLSGIQGCITSITPSASPEQPLSNNVKQLPRTSAEELTKQGEIDYIYTLMAYAVVHKNWQRETSGVKRGYNIGSVLVNQKNEAVYWARNAVIQTHNKTQHGEVRLINCYLANYGSPGSMDLKGYTIYTTLEPCAMCTGMMVLTNVPRVVYGQKDPEFGDALLRLKIDSTNCGGSTPYPRTQNMTSEAADCKYRNQLEFFYTSWKQTNPKKSIVDFLYTDIAHIIYDDATNEFLYTYTVRHPENQSIYNEARRYYERHVPKSYERLCPTQ